MAHEPGVLLPLFMDAAPAGTGSGRWGITDDHYASSVCHRPALAVPAGAIVALIACSLRTVQQLVTWDNTISVGEQAIAATRDNYFVHGYLGHAYLDAGLPQKAWNHFARAMELRPVGAGALNGFGV